MRIDKYLKVSRLIKRRTTAAEACTAGAVQLNGRTAKPGAEVREGDVLEITLGQNVRRVRVLAIAESPRKEDAALMYEEI